MLLKIILLLLVIAMLISLSGALKALFNRSEKTFHWLVVRASLAFAIIVVLAIGFFTGQFTIGAPWTGQY